MKKLSLAIYALLLVGLVLAPFFGAYPVFVMKLMCFALFASAFNLLLGYTGLLSFGHAAFLGGSAYVAGYGVRSLGFTPELGLLAGTLTGAFLGWVQALMLTDMFTDIADFNARVENNLGGLMGNFFFGFMLVSVAMVGYLLGLPLDVRHVTLSSTYFAFAAATSTWSRRSSSACSAPAPCTRATTR